MAIVGGIAGYGIYARLHNRPHFEIADIQPVAVVESLEDSAEGRYHHVQPGDPMGLLGGEGHQMLHGEISWRVPPGLNPKWNEGGWFEIVILDNRSHLKPGYVMGVSASGENVVSGGDGVLNKVAEQYPWLRGAGDIKIGEHEWREGGLTLATATTAGSVRFLADFAPIEGDDLRFLASAPIRLSDILIALIYIGPDRQVFWAARLYG